LLGPTVAQNLIFALNDLLASQNVFMSVILNHYENRMMLYRELGIMELDDCGIWIDKPIEESDWLTEDQCPVPPAVPQAWLDEAGVDAEDVERYAAQQAAEGNLNPADVDLMALPQDDSGDGDAAEESTSNKLQTALSALSIDGLPRREGEADPPSSEPQSRIRSRTAEASLADRGEMPMPPDTPDDEFESEPGALPMNLEPARSFRSGPVLRR
jgi:hypothetical protein